MIDIIKEAFNNIDPAARERVKRNKKEQT